MPDNILLETFEKYRPAFDELNLFFQQRKLKPLEVYFLIKFYSEILCLYLLSEIQAKKPEGEQK